MACIHSRSYDPFFTFTFLLSLEKIAGAGRAFISGSEADREWAANESSFTSIPAAWQTERVARSKGLLARAAVDQAHYETLPCQHPFRQLEPKKSNRSRLVRGNGWQRSLSILHVSFLDATTALPFDRGLEGQHTVKQCLIAFREDM